MELKWTIQDRLRTPTRGYSNGFENCIIDDACGEYGPKTIQIAVTVDDMLVCGLDVRGEDFRIPDRAA